MKPWPHTTVTFVSSGEGSGHVTRSVLVNDTPVTVALGGVEVSQPAPDEEQTVTLTLMPDEVHFVGPGEDTPASTETARNGDLSDDGGDQDTTARNLDALKHEAETPMREHGECCDEEPHPDDDLAKDLHDADFARNHLVRSWEDALDEWKGAYRNLARVAREHIEAEMHECYAKEDATAHDRAEKAELELKIVRDAFESAVRRADDWKARAEKAEVERDEWEDKARAEQDILKERTRERDDWKAKHAALRADVEALRDGCRDRPNGSVSRIHPHAVARHVDWYVLGHDAARTPQPDPDTVTLRREGLTKPTVLRSAASDLRRNHHLGINGLPKSLPATLDALADAMEADQ